MKQIVVLVRYLQEGVEVRSSFGFVTENSYLVVGETMERWTDTAVNCSSPATKRSRSVQLPKRS